MLLYVVVAHLTRALFVVWLPLTNDIFVLSDPVFDVIGPCLIRAFTRQKTESKAASYRFDIWLSLFKC